MELQQQKVFRQHPQLRESNIREELIWQWYIVRNRVWQQVLKLPNGSVGQLLDVMDYISNSFLMPFISLLTSILIGWVIGPDWIIGEVERNGEHFKRAGLYRFMIRYVVPIVMLILFLVSTGFADLIF